jgi:hypothetical protein
LVGFAGLADGGVEVGPFLRLVLGLEEMTYGAEAAGKVGTLSVSLVELDKLTRPPSSAG